MKSLYGAMALALTTPMTLLAGDFDGSKPLVCAVIHATEAWAEESEHLEGNRMSLQGTDGEHSWSMLISEKTGSMTLAVAGEEVGFVVFGACTPR